jgi:hypothetical protein
LSGTLISPQKRDFMRRYILILIVAISSPLYMPKARGQKKKAYVLGVSALYYNRAQIDGIPKTLAADTDITTQIYTEYGLNII